MDKIPKHIFLTFSNRDLKPCAEMFCLQSNFHHPVKIFTPAASRNITLVTPHTYVHICIYLEWNGLVVGLGK